MYYTACNSVPTQAFFFPFIVLGNSVLVLVLLCSEDRYLLNRQYLMSACDTGEVYFSPLKGTMRFSHDHLFHAPTLHEDLSNITIIPCHQKFLKERSQGIILLPHCHD